jgi:hypothetical protein
MRGASNFRALPQHFANPASAGVVISYPFWFASPAPATPAHFGYPTPLILAVSIFRHLPPAPHCCRAAYLYLVNSGTAKVPLNLWFKAWAASTRYAMNPAEEFRRHAAECGRVASSRRGDEKATWSQMAARWLACAKQADDAYTAVRFRIEADRSKPHRKLTRRWPHEPRVS